MKFHPSWRALANWWLLDKGAFQLTSRLHRLFVFQWMACAHRAALGELSAIKKSTWSWVGRGWGYERSWREGWVSYNMRVWNSLFNLKINTVVTFFLLLAFCLSVLYVNKSLYKQIWTFKNKLLLKYLLFQWNAKSYGASWLILN